jgi:hypothetical protein
MEDTIRRTAAALLSVGLVALGLSATASAAAPARCTITGTSGDDVLRGTSHRDVICGLGGDDRIAGGAGNDVLRGGPGRDQLYGGAGRDRLDGGPGEDLEIQDDVSADAAECHDDAQVDCRFDLTWDTGECGNVPFGQGSAGCIKHGSPEGPKGFNVQTLFGWTQRQGDIHIGIYADPDPDYPPDDPAFRAILSGAIPAASSEKLAVDDAFAHEWRNVILHGYGKYRTLNEPGKGAGQPGGPLYLDVENTCHWYSTVCGLHIHVFGYLHRYEIQPV